VGDLLDFDAAFLTRHDHGFLRGSIEHDSEIQLTRDLEALFDEHALDHTAFGPGLIRYEAHAEHLRRGVADLGWALHDLDAATLASAAGMNLRLHDSDAATQPLRNRARVVRIECDLATRDGHSILLEDLFALIFVNLHADAESTKDDSGNGFRESIPGVRYNCRLEK
jgi:hypothetical protein